jgi:2-oxoglutarate/2-oxoacid ferredoxin oxidoreductase subunit alpha
MSTHRRIRLLQGNEASAEGAVAAGCRFFAGYPITPSTEIAEVLSERLPEVGGRFIQMEDEIASIGAVIGASAAGVKSMTATSGPGFSLMQENLGYAAMAEVPCVIVNVQRGGPSTGLPTKAHQGDMMQARWGTHGDHPIIAICPSSVREAFDFTVEAFNLSEQYRVPVIVLLDEIIGHMREKIEIPDPSEIDTYERRRPTVPPEDYRHYGEGTSTFGPVASFGQGYRFIIEGLTHNESGYTTNKPEVIAWNMQRLKDKIDLHRNKLARVYEEDCAGAPIVVFAYGSTARSALQAVRDARAEGLKVGFFRPLIVWPFPEERLVSAARDARVVIVPELNQGQMRLEVERVNRGRARIVGIEQVDGEMMVPERILDEIRRAANG